MEREMTTDGHTHDCSKLLMKTEKSKQLEVQYVVNIKEKRCVCITGQNENAWEDSMQKSLVFFQFNNP